MTTRHDPPRSAQRGTILVAVLPAAVMAAALIFLSLASTTADLREGASRRHRHRALRAAEGALAVAQAQIKTAVYDARGNTALRDALDTTSTGLLNKLGKPIHRLLSDTTGEVWASEIQDGLYQLDAVARVGGATAHVRSLVNERDSFARYTLFVNSRTVNLMGAVSDGRMHSNESVRFYYPDYDYPVVTAVSGFEWRYGADESNTTLANGSNPSANEIPMPDLGAIQARSAFSDGALDALLGGVAASLFNVSLELLDDGYEFTAVHKTTGLRLRTGKLPLPSTGVIYVDGDLAGLEGTLQGRVTVAVTGDIELTGSLQYVDADGDTAYLNGLPSDAALPYEPNPAYDGKAALGVMAGGNVHYSDSIPGQVELNAYFFSRGGFGVPDSGFDVRPTLRSLGGHTVENYVIGAYTSRGNVVAGFENRIYLFDSNLAAAPPPRFLAIDEPRFAAMRIVNGMRGAGSGESDRWNLNDWDMGGVLPDLPEIPDLPNPLGG